MKIVLRRNSDESYLAYFNFTTIPKVGDTLSQSQRGRKGSYLVKRVALQADVSKTKGKAQNATVYVEQL